ncbi:protein translocase subunit SecDF [Vallitalea longa]|uniref:Multifunctional fusion protein n=1 Tax=Vallitalea longa TaxID=2936439 RepID=A0A9W5YBD3_9FIRM|nr:protein translocase subunit SecD [Vallitalea longa]GKX29381.1 protein translocase subunit SecDF [Vallitalea longa]
MKGKKIITLLLLVVIIGCSVFVAVKGVGNKEIGGANNVRLGLDLAGGVSITYTTVKDDPTDKELNDTVFKIRKRIDGLGYTEGQVYREGKDRVNVDIPNATDAEQVLEELGKPGKLEFIGPDGQVVLTGEDVKDATAMKSNQVEVGNSDPYYISLELNESGKDKFYEATKKNVGKKIAIAYNGHNIMEPIVNGPIPDGKASIDHMGSMDRAETMASNIRIGALPLELEELRSNVVGATLGEEAVNTSVKAGIIGLALILLFMIIYYRIPGLAADIALVFYSSLVIIILSIFKLTLTLPGIAGIILSVGMAVDANVIIFSRIKEELALEKTLRASLKAGFKKATTAILDGNITTLIASAILYLMGTGPIKGFAQTLAIGIIVSMFTALVITRLILGAFAGIGIKNRKLYGITNKTRALKVVAKRKVWFSISIIVIVVGLLAMPIYNSTKGTPLNYDIEFSGGTTTLVNLNKTMSKAEMDSELTPIVTEATNDKSPQFQAVKDKGQVIIKTSKLDNEARTKLQESLSEKYGITAADIESESISPTISSEMRRSAIISIILASICMLIYITLRFKDYRFGVSAVVALLHDVFIVLAVYSLFRIPINNSFIAAMLTIVGYSINDTIVLFDRVRENQKYMKRGDFKGAVDTSISQTMSRSINTSLTTFVMVAVLYVLGVASIREFALPLMVGILSGTYSSIFIASPLWYVFKRKEEQRIQRARQPQR